MVGPHGAGLANMVHCAPGTVVLVLPAGDAGASAVGVGRSVCASRRGAGLGSALLPDGRAAVDVPQLLEI